MRRILWKNLATLLAGGALCLLGLAAVFDASSRVIEQGIGRGLLKAGIIILGGIIILSVNLVRDVMHDRELSKIPFANADDSPLRFRANQDSTPVACVEPAMPSDQTQELYNRSST